MRRRMSPLWSPPWAALWGGRGFRGTSAGLRGSWGLLGRFLGGRAWQVEEALVLLVGLVQHRGESGNLLAIVPFPFLCRLELFTQDVHQALQGGR